ncbi:MAG: DUF1376 domain-containing protein [Methylotenera sp.]|uniref:DUF1376 domain-containing protein n=1 Tax=Methylotenera sp. TaxID=2051956 RepID=UPI0024893D69|nr:DUF1376 domain-containing protein [Methylotenera sp.]MDI1307797.1 DUF1376 domain-containing protein [Methylotenera sp.]
MATKTNKDPMAWLKLNVGLFLHEINNLSDAHVAVYIKLLVAYWTNGNKLPPLGSAFNRRIDIKDTRGEEVLKEILEEFFKVDSNGIYSHQELDRQLSEIKAFSQAQSVRASKPRYPNDKPSSSNVDTIDDEDNF